MPPMGRSSGPSCGERAPSSSRSAVIKRHLLLIGVPVGVAMYSMGHFGEHPAASLPVPPGTVTALANG